MTVWVRPKVAIFRCFLYVHIQKWLKLKLWKNSTNSFNLCLEIIINLIYCILKDINYSVCESGLDLAGFLNNFIEIFGLLVYEYMKKVGRFSETSVQMCKMKLPINFLLLWKSLYLPSIQFSILYLSVHVQENYLIYIKCLIAYYI